MPSEHWAGGHLKPLRQDLPALDRDLAVGLRAAFEVTGMSLREYAKRHPLHPSTVSRYLSGEQFPPESFLTKAVELAGDRLAPRQAAALRDLHGRKARETADRSQGRVRTLTARVQRQESEIRDLRRRLGASRAPSAASSVAGAAPTTAVSPDDAVFTMHALALDAMRAPGPRSLVRALDYWSEDRPSARGAAVRGTSESAFRGHLGAGGSAAPLLASWRQALTWWDHAERPRWTDTPARTFERRIAVYDCLDLEPGTRRLLTELVPMSFSEGPIVIGGEQAPWYTPAHRPGHPWYWSAYEGHLTRVRGWSTAAVAGVAESAAQVVARLADPTSATAYQSKGLVVGYVQSGKTANIIGVIAKAVDAGYRLVIVLSGTLNLLRAQTQRRIDMELVGRENILRDAPEEDCEYAADPEWRAGRFLSHGGLPSRLGAFDVLRLTTLDSDYQSLRQGITALEFERRDPALPLHHPSNLHRTAARLMVVKKNKSVLDALVRDLRRLGPQLAEIPVLIVDDESDHGSVNTLPGWTPREGRERSAINGLISRLLGMLPRAQYVAYTATPFANVLIDPSDSEDVFPKDFVLSLPRPAGYMGVRDFHDIDSDVPPEQRTVANSREMAHVRPLCEEADDGSSLREALDAFVLSGALKLYRAAVDPAGAAYRHHTMLVHESVRVADHRELRERLLGLWAEAGAGAPGAAHVDRLRALHERDFAPVSAQHAAGLAVPSSFDELVPYVAAARARIAGDGEPVIVVNSDRDVETVGVDFERRPVWKVLVGGAKLARGFTVEGLTVSYYRRAASQADTLMQMGRWFGFRPGYADLVRLYISRGRGATGKEPDLYEAFEAMCRDEEEFRSQLRDYAALVDGRPMVTPAQLPPLVAQFLPWLRPTSRSKMHNAELVETAAPDSWIEPSGYPAEAAAKRRNTERWRPVLKTLKGPVSTVSVAAEGHRRGISFPAYRTVVPHARLLQVLGELEWCDPGTFARHLDRLRYAGTAGAEIRDWLFLAPQLTSPRSRAGTVLESAELSLFVRARRRWPHFGRISDPRHRDAARSLRSGPADGRGIALLYPVLDPEDADAYTDMPPGVPVRPSGITLAFCLLPPGRSKRSVDPTAPLVRFRAKDSSLTGHPGTDG
ncbi:Z1 domain-containing protein [Streptomyces sp. NPDC052114]|uniref:Z1 domain-containing protein n=1 Tax=unclassified Streptomyces TaxID=2593676 RepID=UPI00341FC3BA